MARISTLTCVATRYSALADGARSSAKPAPRKAISRGIKSGEATCSYSSDHSAARKNVKTRFAS
jgi:hypothetical protein